MEAQVTQYWRSIKFRLHHSWRVLAIVFAITLVALGAIYIIGYSTHIPVSEFSRDPAILAERPFYWGLLSNLGVILWSSAATCCVFSAVLLHGDPRKVLFMLVSGLGSLYLGMDDVLMIHDSIFPDYLLVEEKFIYLIYILLSVIYVLYFYKEILIDTDFPLLAAATVFFAISILMDLYIPFTEQGTFFEDGSKLVGIALWLTYFARTGVQWIRTLMNSGPQNQVQ